MKLTMPWKAPTDNSANGVTAKWEEMRHALTQEADHLAQVAAQLSREASARTAGATAPVVDAAGTGVKHANGWLGELIKAAAGISPVLALSGRKAVKDLRHVRLTTEPKQTKPDFMPGISLLAGFGAGLALMYFLDPERGRARRKLLSGKLAAWTQRQQLKAQMLHVAEAQPEPLPWADDAGKGTEGNGSPIVDGSTTDAWGEQPQPSVSGSSVA